MKLDLQESVSSSQDLKVVTLDVQKYAAWFAHYTIKTRTSPNKPTDEPPAVSQAAVTLIRELADEKQLNQKNLDALIAKLQALETTSLRVTITLAAPPPMSLKKMLSVVPGAHRPKHFSRFSI
jgi:hypothetical protein